MKKIISYLVLIIFICTLCSCGEVVEDPNKGNGQIDNPIINPGGNNNQTPPPSEEKVEFKVSLIYNKQTYKPKANEQIQVVWSDDYTQYTETIAGDSQKKNLMVTLTYI